MDFYDQIVGVARPLLKIYHRIESFGEDNLPANGEGFILAPNHTNWFGWDALLISSALPERRVRWIAWSYSGKIPLWDAQISAFNAIPYNREKRLQYDRLAEELRRGVSIGVFPEGSNNPVGKWYRLRPFFPGCIRLSVMSGVPIVPVSVAGLEEASPILWIKEEEKESPTWLLALPGLLPTKVTVRFGEPVMPELTGDDLADKDRLFAEAAVIQSKVLELLKNDRPGAYAEDFTGRRRDF